MTLYTLAESNIRKTWFYLGFFLVLILLIGRFLSYYFESQFLFLVALFLSIFASIGSFWFSDKIVLAMSSARLIEKKDNPELYRLVENLCITAGLPLPKVYIINDSAPNAFATGRDPNHSVIAVTQGLLDKLERTELEGVISHELAHIGNRDAFLQTIVVILVGLIIRVVDFFFRSEIKPKRDSDEKGPPILFILGIIFLILAPIFAQLIRFAISRKREFLADATGALLTRYPEGLASALEKISQDQEALEAATNATAHLYIVNPFKGKQAKSFLAKLFSTHPPVEQRVKALRGLRT
ncbi:MAG: heat-shock protein HtpX [candidate division Zixibacteria bacterium SM23_73]|nr:MAG: heat-shock protein HtpX [candidate division Zixibacteria bacterium SM23_73]